MQCFAIFVSDSPKHDFMNKRLMNIKRSLRFRRWSRKAYSVLISLKNHVTIGHVCKSITDASCLKSSAAVSDDLHYPYRNNRKDRLKTESESDLSWIMDITGMPAQVITDIMTVRTMSGPCESYYTEHSDYYLTAARYRYRQ